MKPTMIKYVVMLSSGMRPASLPDFVNFFQDGRYAEMISKGFSEDMMFSVYQIDIQIALLPGPFAHTVKPELKKKIAEIFYIVTR